MDNSFLNVVCNYLNYYCYLCVEINGFLVELFCGYMKDILDYTSFNLDSARVIYREIDTELNSIVIGVRVYERD